jgi:uncharacterized membrane protein
MGDSILKWLRKFYNKTIHSIAFYPAIMGVGFLMLAILAMELDAKGMGEHLNKQFKWLTLKDAATARTIVATVAAGIISLTVFSFSMVMIVMNQAASQMSNRMLDTIIGDRFQKAVLGSYIGTIVYSLFLLSNISEVDKETTVPSLSVYLLLALTVFNIFLFVYFLHYITQSIRYEQLIRRIHNSSMATLRKYCSTKGNSIHENISINGIEVPARDSGYFQGFSLKQLLKHAIAHDVTIQFIVSEGSYVLKDTPFAVISKEVAQEYMDQMYLEFDFYYGQEIDNNPYYGFLHLMEVGVKALSPGINDPGTAVLSLNSLTDMLAYRLKHRIPNVITDDKGRPRIITKEISFQELFTCSVLPIWDYGKKDRLVQNGVIHLLNQLQTIDKKSEHINLFTQFMKEVKVQQKELFAPS